MLASRFTPSYFRTVWLPTVPTVMVPFESLSSATEKLFAADDDEDVDDEEVEDDVDGECAFDGSAAAFCDGCELEAPRLE